MRNKILSITIAALIMAGFFLTNHFLRGDDRGQAMAAAGIHADIDSKSRKALRREISYAPKALLQLNAQHVRGLFNEPGLVRAEAPVTIWQYRTESCVLDLYFKGSEKNNFKSVEHYEIRAREKGVDDADVQDECVSEILRSRNGFQMVGVNNFYKPLSK